MSAVTTCGHWGAGEIRAFLYGSWQGRRRWCVSQTRLGKGKVTPRRPRSWGDNHHSMRPPQTHGQNEAQEHVATQSNGVGGKFLSQSQRTQSAQHPTGHGNPSPLNLDAPGTHVSTEPGATPAQGVSLGVPIFSCNLGTWLVPFVRSCPGAGVSIFGFQRELAYTHTPLVGHPPGLCQVC